MDVYFVLNGIKFVWNDAKAQVNPRKHDVITFHQAAEAFFDTFLMVVDASRKMKYEMPLLDWISVGNSCM